MKKETRIVINSDGAITLCWYLHGDTKTTQFTVLLYKCQQEGFSYRGTLLPTDVGYHADTPKYDQDSMECHLRPSGRCFYDGSSLAANELWELFITSGKEDVIWSKLEDVMTW